MTRTILLCVICFALGAWASYRWLALRIAERDLLLAQGEMLIHIQRLEDVNDGRVSSVKDWLVQAVHCDRLLGERLMVNWPALQSDITSHILSQADQFPGHCYEKNEIEDSARLRVNS